MPRILLAALTLVAALALASPALAASRQATALKRELGPGAKVASHGETGQVRFVGAPAGGALPSGAARGASARAAARAFLGSHGKAFGLSDPARDLRVTASEARSVRMQQLHDGVPVIGGELVVTLDAGHNVLSASGEALPAPDVATSPRIGSAVARAAAVAAVAKERGVQAFRLDADIPSLAIHDPRILGGPGFERSTLVWRVVVKDGLAIDELVLVDAVLGSVVATIDQIEEAKNRQVCDGANSAAQYPCVTPVRSEGEGAHPQPEVNNAYNFSGDTYDFFIGLGRDSLDGAGLALKSTVRHCPTTCPFNNAFWDGQQMVYGNGFAAADDVVGHELTHGVTDFSAELFYYYQSGAINESMSDVFGEFVDLTNTAGTDTAAVRWQVGEDLPTFGAIRDMENPPAFGHPDRMTSPNYTADANEVDSGGVHQNSGVNNKAAFLMTDGGTFNGRTVTGLGIPKVSRIYYRVLTQKLTSASDYADLASALPQACAELVGTAGITASDCTEVGDAVAAVEMSTPPPAAPNSEAPVCAPGHTATNLFFDDLENTSSGNWTAQAGGSWFYPQPGTYTYATSGTTNFFGFDRTTAGDFSISMNNSVAIPAGSTAFLRFNHAYGFEDAGGAAFDGGVLEISVNGGPFTDIGARLTDGGYNGTLSITSNNPIEGRSAFVAESNGYIASRANLSSDAGQSVRFRFRIGTDTGNLNANTDVYGWFVDDIRIYTCAPPPPPPPPPPDSDGDGVPDASDVCPSVPGTLPNGCVPDGGGGSGDGSGGTGGGSTGGGGTTGATLASARLRSCKRSGTGKQARVRCTLRGFSAVRRATVTVKRNGKTVGKKTLRPTSRGVLSFKPRKALRKGTYKVTIVLRDAAGDKLTLKKSFKVK